MRDWYYHICTVLLEPALLAHTRNIRLDKLGLDFVFLFPLDSFTYVFTEDITNDR